VLVSLAVGASLMFPLDRFGVGELRYGAAGLALGSAVGAWFEFILLRRALGRQIGPHGPGRGPVTRMALAGVAALGVGLGAKIVLGYSSAGGILPDLLGEASIWLDPLAAIGTAGAFGLAYLGITALLGVGIPLRRSS